MNDLSLLISTLSLKSPSNLTTAMTRPKRASSDPEKPLPKPAFLSCDGKETRSIPTGKEAASTSLAGLFVEKQLPYNSTEKEVAPRSEITRSKAPQPRDSNPSHRPHRRCQKRIWVTIIVLVLIILTIVFGLVLGLKMNHSSSTMTRPSNNSATSPAMTPRLGPGSTNRNIAACSFVSKSVNYTHVFFQNEAGKILEATNSALNATWLVHETGVGGKNGSPIAAAVSRPYFPLVSMSLSTSTSET